MTTKNMLIAATLTLMTLTACGADVEAACDGYISSVTDCINEAYADDEDTKASTIAAFDGTCDAYDGIKEQSTADYLDCLNTAYADADCSTPESYSSTLDISGCTP